MWRGGVWRGVKCVEGRSSVEGCEICGGEEQCGGM